MPDLFSDPPYILLILGFVLFFAAVVSTCTGKTLAHFRGLVYRAKDPSTMPNISPKRRARVFRFTPGLRMHRVSAECGTNRRL
jgi:hypothetical protein